MSPGRIQVGASCIARHATRPRPRFVFAPAPCMVRNQTHVAQGLRLCALRKNAEQNLSTSERRAALAALVADVQNV